MAEAQNTKVQEQDINQLLKVRREKLAALQEAGKDPFQITKYDVTHHSTDIKENFDELLDVLDDFITDNFDLNYNLNDKGKINSIRN